MPKYELAIAIADKPDHTPGKFCKKEGDISSIKPYPRNCGRKVIDEYLIVIVECNKAEIKTRLRAPLWANGLVEGVDFRDIEKEDGLDPIVYPSQDYVWDIQANMPMKRPKELAKRRYKIPLNILGNIDMAKVQNKIYIYQPFKKASQLVQKFDGINSPYDLKIKDVDCTASGIGTEQEVVFQWSAIDNLVMDKYTNLYVKP